MKDFKYPILFRHSKLNYEKKNSLTKTIAQNEEEIDYLHKDIANLNLDLAKIRKAKAGNLVQRLVNELEMKVADEMYNIHFLKDLEEKKRKEREKAEMGEMREGEMGVGS